MNVEDVKALKEKLEASISEDLKEFEKVTGTSITDLDLFRKRDVMSCDEGTSVDRVRITVSI